MSIAVQSNLAANPQGTVSLSCAFNSPNTGGNTIIAVGFFEGYVISTLSISDSQNNNYEVLHGPDNPLGGNRCSMVWRATKVAAGDNTVTIEGGSAPFIESGLYLVILEYPVGVCDGSVDQFVSNWGPGTPTTIGPTSNLSQSGELALAYGVDWNTNEVYSLSGAWQIEQQESDNSTSCFVADLQAGSTSALEANLSSSPEGAGCGLFLLTIENGTGGGGGAVGADGTQVKVIAAGSEYGPIGSVVVLAASVAAQKITAGEVEAFGSAPSDGKKVQIVANGYGYIVGSTPTLSTSIANTLIAQGAAEAV